MGVSNATTQQNRRNSQSNIPVIHFQHFWSAVTTIVRYVLFFYVSEIHKITLKVLFYKFCSVSVEVRNGHSSYVLIWEWEQIFLPRIVVYTDHNNIYLMGNYSLNYILIGDLH